MKHDFEMILKAIPQYDNVKQDADIPPIHPATRRCYCIGWLSGAKAAVDAILENDEIRRMVYKEVEFQYRVEDAKSHLRDYIGDEKKYNAVINSGLPEVVAERFLDSHDCNAAENDQFEIIIEDLLRKRVV